MKKLLIALLIISASCTKDLQPVKPPLSDVNMVYGYTVCGCGLERMGFTKYFTRKDSAVITVTDNDSLVWIREGDIDTTVKN